MADKYKSAFTFVDLFAGCGGLSAGMVQAGGRGLFAIERSVDAFATFERNFLGESCYAGAYQWPEWLPKQAHDIVGFIEKYRDPLESLRGQIDLIVGGPPCQGFSVYGERNPNDPRNLLVHSFLDVVKLTQPRAVLIENVEGIDMPFYRFKGQSLGTDSQTSAAAQVAKILESLGYDVSAGTLCASKYGVPQRRQRFFILGVQRGSFKSNQWDLFQEDVLSDRRARFLSSLNLDTEDITVEEAISDLEVDRFGTRPCCDPIGTAQVAYQGPLTAYQSVMSGGWPAEMLNSLRLANHREPTLLKFRAIHQTCKPGRSITVEDRARLGMKKNRLHLLARDRPAPTLTTLPDDILHYSEPRILTVREMARLQSFPDMFEFVGPFGTGGNDRRTRCPRYSQVGNAVPVRLAQFLGEFISDVVLTGDRLVRFAA